MGATAATHVKRYLRAAKPGDIPSPAPAPDFERHQRKCAICRHPEREAIEELFIYWHSADSIQCLFKLPDWSTVYRHARAAGLYELRRHNIRGRPRTSPRRRRRCRSHAPEHRRRRPCLRLPHRLRLLGRAYQTRHRHLWPRPSRFS